MGRKQHLLQEQQQQQHTGESSQALLKKKCQQEPSCDAVLDISSGGRSKTSNSNSSKSEKIKLIGALCVFLFGYCGQPILVDFCRYQGVASASTFLFLLPHFIGMLVAGSLPLSADSKRPESRAQLRNPRLWRRAFRLALIDLSHQLLEKAGLVLCGSGVYILLSSTSIVWTAVLSALILGRKFSPLKYFSLSLIVAGVSIKASNLSLTFSSQESLGMILSLLAAILQGLTFVLNERFMEDEDAPITGLNLVFMMGYVAVAVTAGAAVAAAAAIAYAVAVAESYCGFCVRQQGHQHWAAVGVDLCVDAAPGAVTSGALKGCKAAAVVVLSHVLFCSVQESQCIGVRKGIAAAMCVAGVVLHSVL
ncbi:hypothetical protein, conserved [Eimeria tenella]|uniref:Sugar phosphate transporter domain-containing protein n=1 Tax=Eimeria tenella TaxID=5802 RepID=U6KM38_EIMTE|nr:hypothetical protein, conserved [Eimeria tenella]CDJ39061.1 hypothetical protein, conserved [Eimeria tenella]|eukprot:XP_013229816.1 hypothetical protein, conserved [Eimeria tenella]